MNKAKLFICFIKLISVLNVGLQKIKDNFPVRKPLHGLDLCINCKIPLYPMKLSYTAKAKMPFYAIYDAD